jgi:hypothetical protein
MTSMQLNGVIHQQQSYMACEVGLSIIEETNQPLAQQLASFITKWYAKVELCTKLPSGVPKSILHRVFTNTHKNNGVLIKGLWDTTKRNIIMEIIPNRKRLCPGDQLPSGKALEEMLLETRKGAWVLYETDRINNNQQHTMAKTASSSKSGEI